MKATALYLDSSVLGGYFDDEFRDATRELWSQMEQGRWQFVSSVVVDLEVSKAPERVRRLLRDTFTDSDTVLPLTEEAEDLAQAYLKQKAVSADYADDARHVAIAVTHGIGIVVSWNYRHLANLRRETAFNGVNLLQGYPPVRIVSPLELIYGTEEETI
jgi:predicted nucleic acid-binding protein